MNFNFNTTMTIIIGIISVLLFIYNVYKAKQQNKKDLTQIVLEKLRPSLTEFLTDISDYKKNVSDYDSFEDFAVNFILVKIDELNLLNDSEKEIVDDSFVRALVKSYLENIWRTNNK